MCMHVYLCVRVCICMLECVLACVCFCMHAREEEDDGRARGRFRVDPSCKAELVKIFKNATQYGDTLVPEDLGKGCRKTKKKAETWALYPEFLAMIGELHRIKPGLRFDKVHELNPALAEACPFLADPLPDVEVLRVFHV